MGDLKDPRWMYLKEQNIDGDYRFSGVFDFLKYLLTRRRPPTD